MQWGRGPSPDITDVGEVPQPAIGRKAQPILARKDIIRRYRPYWEKFHSEPSRRGARPISWTQMDKLAKQALAICERHDREGIRLDTYNPPVPMTLPFDWSLNPFRDRSWCRRLQSLQMTECFFDAYEETGQRKYLARGRDIVMDWIEFALVRNEYLFMKWLDMATGFRAMKIAYLLDKILAGELRIPDRQGAILLFAAHEHLKRLLHPAALSTFNHGIFQLHGLAILASVAWVLPESEEGLQYCQTKMAELLNTQFSDEGPHLEHSAGYHFWMRLQLKKLEATGWHGQLYSPEKWNNIDDCGHWFTTPDGRAVLFGDTPPNKVVEEFGFNKCDFCDGQFVVRWYAESGYAVVKDSATSAQGNYLAIQAGRHSSTHKHWDDLHFEFWDSGRPIFVDSGADGYKATAHRLYSRSARAHNVVELEDIRPEEGAPENFGSGLEKISIHRNFATIVASAPLCNSGPTVRRELAYSPGNRLYIRDRIFSAGKRAFTQWLQLHQSFTLVAKNEQSIEFTTADGYSLSIRIPKGARVQLRRGESEPRLAGWRAIGPQSWTEAWSVGFTFIDSNFEIETIVLLNGGAGPSLPEGEPLWHRERECRMPPRTPAAAEAVLETVA
jgi:hypothetical protein